MRTGYLFFDAVNDGRIICGGGLVAAGQLEQGADILLIGGLYVEGRRVRFKIIVSVRQADTRLADMGNVDAAVLVVGRKFKPDNGAVVVYLFSGHEPHQRWHVPDGVDVQEYASQGTVSALVDGCGVHTGGGKVPYFLVDASGFIGCFRATVKNILQELFLRDVKEKIRTHARLVVGNLCGIVPPPV